MIGRDDVNIFVSSSGSQFQWLHQFWNLHSNSLWLTYSRIRPNIISKTKNNDIQLSSTSSFSRQSELDKLEMYFTQYIYIDLYIICNISITTKNTFLSSLLCFFYLFFNYIWPNFAISESEWVTMQISK